MLFAQLLSCLPSAPFLSLLCVTRNPSHVPGYSSCSNSSREITEKSLLRFRLRKLWLLLLLFFCVRGTSYNGCASDVQPTQIMCTWSQLPSDDPCLTFEFLLGKSWQWLSTIYNIRSTHELLRAFSLGSVREIWVAHHSNCTKWWVSFGSPKETYVAVLQNLSLIPSK